MRLMTTNEGSTTQVVSTKDSNAVNGPFPEWVRAIKEVGGDGGKVDEVGIINANSTKASKSGKSKDVV